MKRCRDIWDGVKGFVVVGVGLELGSGLWDCLGGFLWILGAILIAVEFFMGWGLGLIEVISRTWIAMSR